MEREWPFLMNPFNSDHNSPFVKFVGIFRFSVSAFDSAKLENPKYMEAYTLLNSKLGVYEDLFANWLAAKGPAESAVAEFAALLKDESTQVHLWNQGVEKFYLNTTTNWATMFPHKLSGFYEPTTEEGRVLEVQAFVNRTEPFTSVIDVTVMAQDYHDTIHTSLVKKELAARALEKSSTNLKEYQETVADDLYGVLGSMMELHKKTPLKTKKFFNLEEIRSSKPRESIKLKVNEYQYYVGPHQFVEVLANFDKRSIVKGRVYIGTCFKLFTDAVVTTSTLKMPSSFITYGAKEIKENDISELGSTNNRHLMIYNDSDEEGMLVITIK